MKHIATFVIAITLTSCSANTLNPSAKTVKVINTDPGKECTYLGDVTGNQGNFFSGGFTSNSNLETGARNDLKNRAARMGGNVVSLLTQRAGQTGSSFEGSGSIEQTNVTLTGNVYHCPN